MHVQEPRAADARERVLDARRDDHRLARPRTERRASRTELELALEDVEAVGVTKVHVIAGAVVLAVDEVLEHVEVGMLHLDEREAVLLPQAVAVARAADDAAHRR